MLRGLYTSASGMMTQMTRQGVVSNNAANITTAGYKQDISSQGAFRQLMIARIARAEVSTGDSHAASLGALATSAGIHHATIDLAQGSLTDTGGELDLALSGPGFFALQTPDGLQVTRSGAFARDANGQLVAADGALVLGTDGPLNLPPGEVIVAADGTITVNGQPAGQLRLVDVPADQLTKAGQTRFALPAGAEPAAAPAALVNQGFLEASNVDLTRTVTEMMAASRAYEANQHMVQIQDDLLGRAVNDIGRVG